MVTPGLGEAIQGEAAEGEAQYAHGLWRVSARIATVGAASNSAAEAREGAAAGANNEDVRSRWGGCNRQRCVEVTGNGWSLRQNWISFGPTDVWVESPRNVDGDDRCEYYASCYYDDRDGTGYYIGGGSGGGRQKGISARF